MPEPTSTDRLAQIRDRSERLAAIPLETSASNYIMRDMIDSIGDVRWLLAEVNRLCDEATKRGAYVELLERSNAEAAQQNGDMARQLAEVERLRGVARELASQRDEWHRQNGHLRGERDQARTQLAEIGETEVEWGLLADGFDVDRTRGIGKGETGRHTAYAEQQLYHRVMQRRAASDWREAP